METVPLEAGDLGWAFPDEPDPERVRDLLRQADRQMSELAIALSRETPARHLGLSFVRLPSGRANIWGWAENDDVTFEVEIDLPKDPMEWTVTQPPPWRVEGTISVRCDGVTDCGSHTIERIETEQWSAGEAAQSLVDVAGAILDRAKTVPSDRWRELDPDRGHAN